MFAFLSGLIAGTILLLLLCIGGARPVFALPGYALVATAGVMAGLFWNSPWHTGKGGVRLLKWCLGATLLCFTYLLARAFWSPVEFLARNDVWMLLACLVVYGIIALWVRKAEHRWPLLWALMLMACVQFFLGLYQFTSGNRWMPFGFLRPEGGDFIWRAGGTLVSSIHLAGYLEAVAPFAVGLAVFGVRSWVPRVFAVAVALLSYSGVLLTGSRGGYISSIFSILVMAALALWLGLRTGMLRRRVLLPVGVAVLLAVMGAAAVALVGQPRMRERLFRSDTTENIRFANWKAAIRQWQKSPWIGTGARTHLYYGRLYREPVLQSDPEHAHNDYLETLAEYGVVGLALLLGVVALHAVSGMQGLGCLAATMREDPYEGPRLELALLFGAIGALAAYIAHSVTDFNLHLPSHALLFAVIFGFLASGGRVEETVPPGRQPRWVIRARWVVPLLAVWLAFLVGPMVPAEYYAEKQRAAVRDVGRGERQLERSIWYGETALRWKPNHPQVYYYLGQANRLLAAQKPYTANRPWLEKAEQAYRKGLEQFPQDFDLWLRLGQTLDAQRRFADAGKAYEEAIRRDPKLAIGHHYHAYHLEKAGYEKKAKEAFERARAFYSGDLDALTNAALHREED